MKPLLFLLLAAGCSLVNSADRELLVGSWLRTETRPLGAGRVQVDLALTFGADGSYRSSEAAAGGVPVVAVGTYKVGYYPPKQVISLFNASGAVVTNTLFFYFEAPNVLATSEHSSFEGKKNWNRN